MNKIDWKSKLTSRKFWAAVVTFVATLLTVFNVPDITIEQVVAVIMAAGAMIAYIIGEGLVDAARLKAVDKTEEYITLTGKAEEIAED